MNPFDLSASDLLIWGLVLHLIADWPLQNDWMAKNKSKLGYAMIVHSGIHGVWLALVFGFWPAVCLAITHAIIDTRKPVVWWSKFVGQTQPEGRSVYTHANEDNTGGPREHSRLLYDVGLEVRFWTDQVFHIVCIAIAALIVA